MEYEEDEGSEYNTSEVDWGQEPDPSWSGEGDYDYGSWRGETDSEISIEEVDERDEEPWYEETNSQGAFEEEEGQVDDEIEPEPPDHFQDTTSNYECYEEENHERDSWSEETESRFSQEKEDHNDRLEHEEFNHEGEPDQFVAPYHKSRPWCEIPYSDHEEEHQEEDRPWCELPEDDYEDASNDGVKPWCEETDSQISLDESPTSYGDEPESKEEFDEDNEAESEAGRDDSGEEYTEADEDVSVVGRDTVRYINFAGHHQGPVAYLRWEQEMEDWLSSNQIPEEEKTIYAEDTLTEDAFRRWEQDAYIRLEYDEPDASWEEMKQLLYEEFVEDAGDMRQYNLRVYANPEPRRWILAKPKATPKRAFIPKPKKETTPALKEKTESKSTSQVKKKKWSAISLLEPHVEPHSELHAEPHPELKQGASHTMDKTVVLISQETTCCDLDSQAPHQSSITIQEDKTPTLKQETNSNPIGNQGTKDDNKGDTLKSKEFMDQNRNREEYTPLLIKRAANGDENFNETIQIKEKPPDENPLEPIQGKILHPHIIQWTNLTYLCVGDQVLRTKLLEEGGYDAVINPRTNHGEDYGRETTTQEQPSGNFNQVLPKTSGQSQFSLPEKTPQPFSVQTKAKIYSSCPEITWNTFSAQLPTTTKKNQPKRSSHEGVIQFSNQMMLSLPYLEADGFNYLQTKLWRPGEFLLQLETPKITSSFILSPWIKWIQSFLIIHQELPYMDPRAFKAQPQRLSSDLVRLKGVIRRLISHGIIQKLSRYKSPRITPFGLSIQSLTAIFFQGTSPLDFFDLFRVLLSYFESLACCTNPRVEPI
ncbi:hypothetical protein ISN45_Aa01g007110 [Arabidopsis thaliana x Arabidopsis arenosa]|uniref:Uncharacterized protein n=1 Tax=Arabidopsis thaliana x Arabidopsis arenosa TaxID=1240361 RepID=A0A8T2C0D5_9BRAS|nr:hypothetical protein ISN45_Aa01g007110 [Arabidopsis thaliana x Arabidopsis arenosa]